MVSIINFCNSSEEYSSFINYMQENQINTVDEFKDHLQYNVLSFLRAFTNLNFGKLETDLAVFEENENKKNERKIDEDDEIINNIIDDEDCQCENLCCAKLRQKLNHLSEKVDTMEIWIKNEMKKIDNPLVINNSMKNGDFLLEDKWLVKGEFLHIAARDSGNSDLANLLDSVFGRKILQKYKSIKDLPNELKKAIDLLIEHYSRAKVVEKGGEYNKIKNNAKQRINKRFDNWNRYQLKKKLSVKSPSTSNDD
ncbi:uncharacterized protein LOC124499190 isoform X2 [Dermatophagoides farinae]|uniref:Uncharacterized protein n=1 Tax=Dermatophagoides farinae TaxID=6954 RepID=A0A922I222_DERFA|nr:uncharacterized protein LOC124497889 isoform X2 [Dermatophagoides farinae]KAH9506101.1 hypothetical protein DERF_010846 [Dermatophagoides farinae]KAH9520561.1 hypothetical protein DERF_004263 [Dermatophagoides farinae]